MGCVLVAPWEATPQGSIGGVGGTQFPPVPSHRLLSWLRRTGKGKIIVCDGREVLHLGIVLFISPRVLATGKGRTQLSILVMAHASEATPSPAVGDGRMPCWILSDPGMTGNSPPFVLLRIAWRTSSNVTSECCSSQTSRRTRARDALFSRPQLGIAT